MKENAIRSAIRKMLFEDHWVANATDDISAGKFTVDSDVKLDLPVSPSPQMPGQISVDAPPVDDDNYVPSSSIDLAKALYHLFKDCPQDQLGFVFASAQKIKTAAETKDKKLDLAEPAIDDQTSFDRPSRVSTKRKLNSKKN
jgi:hypothetical protein